MFHWKALAVSALTLGLFTGIPATPAQIGVEIGVAPVCPYGYYDYSPYNCSPYGYYGPDWFNGGLFIGAGGHGFYGHVDNRYDPRNGYAGPMPGRGDRSFNHFQANEARDGQGHIGNAGHEGGGEHSGGFSGGGRAGGGGHGGSGGRGH